MGTEDRHAFEKMTQTMFSLGCGIITGTYGVLTMPKWILVGGAIVLVFVGATGTYLSEKRRQDEEADT